MSRRLALALALLLSPALAGAHSFGRQYNLPVPFWLYAYGAAAALLLSFLVAGYFLKAGGSQTGGATRDLTDTALLRGLRRWHLPGLLRAASLAALALCVLAGLIGSRNPYTNINMTLFWVWFVLGFAYLSALLGDLYARINPWQSLAQGLARLWPDYARGRLRQPERYGYWPALALYMGFIWLELFGHSKPPSLAWMLLAYSAINLLGVWLWGLRPWVRYGELFAVCLRLMALMAPLELRRQDGRTRVSLRWPFSGLLQSRAEHGSLLVFILFMLSSTAFDGLRETVPWVRLFWTDFYALVKPWVGAEPALAYPRLSEIYRVWQTLALLLSPFLYLALYLGCLWLSRALAGSRLPLRELALRFAYSLLPIALVYHLTHYYTLLMIQGVKIVPMLSDPFGWRWNLFGTAGWLRAAVIPDMGRVWHTQVGLIVFGHIVSVVIAHLEALRSFPGRHRATLSQLPMLLLMVLFTAAGLWILAQPIQSGR